MNTKGIKFLAVLAVLAMAFSAFAVFSLNDENDMEAEVENGLPAKEGFTDAMMAEIGYAVKIKIGTAPELYYDHLEKALGTLISTEEGGAVDALTTDVTVTLLKNDQAEDPMNVLNGSTKGTNTLTIDLNGFTYSATGGISRGGVDGKAISFGIGGNVKIQNGTINVTANDKTAVVIKSYAPVLTLTNVKIDASNLNPTAASDTGTIGGEQFNNADIGKSAALWVANGEATLTSSTIVSAANDTAILVHGFNQGTYVGSTVSSVGSAFVGKVVLSVDGASPLPADPVNAKFVTDDKTSVDGAIIKTANVINSNPGHAAIGGADDFIVQINGGIFTDVNAIGYLVDGKEMTLAADGTLASLALGTSTLNLDTGVTLKITGALTGGKVNLGKGAAITYGSMDGTTIKTTDSGQTVEVKTEEQITDGGKTVAEYVETLQETGAGEAAVVTLSSATAISEQKINVEKADVTFVADAGLATALTGVDITVTSVSSESKSVTFSGFTNGVTGTITTTDGTTKQTVTLDAVKGSFTITKGSVYIDGVLQGGTITLADGADVKITGEVDTSDVSINVPAGKKATVTVEADTVFTITGQTLNIGKGITFNVNGTVTGTGAISLADGATLNVNNGGIIDMSAEDSLVGAGAYNALAGAKITADYAGTGSFTAYSESDINGLAYASNWTKIVGKDATTGTWSFNDGTLTLNNYNGTYNFGGFATNITNIVLVGDSIVSFEAPATPSAIVLFGNDSITSITTVQGTASMVIDVDMSKATALNGGLTVISGTSTATLSIDAISMAVNVYGVNSDWTEEIASAGVFAGITTKNLNLYNADLDMSIMEAYAAAAGYGIDALGTVDISSCADIEIAASGTALKAIGTVTIKQTDVALNGQILGADLAGLTVQNYSSLMISSGMKAVAAVNISQQSILAVDDAELSGVLTNNGEVVVTGDMILTGTINNCAEFSNFGTIGVYGAIDNKDGGIFENSGIINVYAKEANAGKAVALTVTAEAVTTDGIARVGAITIDPDDLTANADGTFTISAATINFIKNGGNFDVSDNVKGTLSVDQIIGSYTLNLSDGSMAVTVSYDSTKTGGPKIGTDYTIAVSGTVYNAEVPYNLDANTVDKAVADGLGGLTKGTTASFTVSGGTFTNEGAVAIYKGATPVNTDGKFVGDLSAYTDIAMAGTMEGNITSTAAVTISGTLTGNVTTDGNVTIAKKMTGDVTSKGNVLVYVDSTTVTATLNGNVIMNNSGAEKTLTVKGIMKGTLTYQSKYKASTTSTAADTDFSSSMAIDGTEKYNDAGLVITAKNGADATASVAVKGGYLALTTATPLAANKAMDMKVTEGKLSVLTSIALPNAYVLTIEDGATIEVAKVATFTIAGSMKVSKDAIKNYELVTIPVTYGKLAYVMTFDISEGYTIFSNAEYALSNCDEGSELTLGTATTATANVAIKAGVNVIINNVKLDMTTYDLSMGEGAKITLVGSGNLAFAATGSKTTSGVETLYFVNGTVVYDDNAIVFEDVRFDAASTIAGIAATSTAPSKLNLALTYDEGTATLVDGMAAGAVNLRNDNYDLNDVATKVSGTYVIAEGTVSEAAVTDMQAVYTAVDHKTLAKPMTSVIVDGIMYVNVNTTINGAYGGEGFVSVADGRTITIVAYAADSVNGDAVVLGEIGNLTGSFTFIVIKANVEVTAVAATSTVPGYVKIAGTIYEGAATADGNVAADNVILNYTEATPLEDEKVGSIVIPEGATFTILNGRELTANGLLMNAGTLNYKTETATTYGTLDYEITFESEGYTVYTQLGSALDLVAEGTSIVIEDDLNATDMKIPAGVTIVIAEGHYLFVNGGGYLVIGEGMTTLGADAVVTGNIVLKDAGAYVVDFAGSNSDISVFIDEDMTRAAPYNAFLIMDAEYATVYAFTADTVLNDGTGVTIDLGLLTPKIEGFYFDQWFLQNGNPVALGGTQLSNGPFVAGMVASKVTVIFSTVAGINYYVDGEIVNTLDAPVKVNYGATITAKISDATAYKGTPLVNGKTYIIVDDSVSKVTGSGVSPITPEPTPTPEEKSEWTITTILLVVLVILIAIMVIVMVLRLNRS